jgi:hypothetical protein
MKMKPLPPHETLDESLQELLVMGERDKVSMGEICRVLAGRGYAIILIVFSLPFCLPITIPGVSTPFGMLLAFMGLRIAFRKHLWWPKFILDKEIAGSTVVKVVTRTQSLLVRVKKFLHPRLMWLVSHPLAHICHGLLIVAMSLLLSLPLPVPFTNTLSALPLLHMGFGLLEDDGLAIVVAYVLAAIAIAYFTFIYTVGSAAFKFWY